MGETDLRDFVAMSMLGPAFLDLAQNNRTPKNVSHLKIHPFHSHLGTCFERGDYSNLNNQPGPVGCNANRSVYWHTSSLIQDRPHRSLSIIGAIRMLNNTANRRIPRASSAENSRLLFLLFLLLLLAVVVGGGGGVVIA
jgi:hypothetical protein